MYDVIIIGGGPAGLTAAMYAGRRALKALALTRDIGGQAAKTNDIENYPGFPHTSGIELAKIFQTQAKDFGAEIAFEEVKKIEKKDDSFSVETIANKYDARTIILALGKQPKELEIPGEEEFKGKGVSYCATCDAPFFRSKVVTIVGGGNSALDAALLCSKISTKVYLIHRNDTFRAEQVLIDKVKEAQNIEIILNDEISEIKGETTVSKVALKSGKELKTDGVIVEVGYIVDRTLIENLVELNENNQIVTGGNQETSVPGIFAAGDVTHTAYKQIVISAGEGAKAALAAYDYIQKQEGKKGIAGDWQKLAKTTK